MINYIFLESGALEQRMDGFTLQAEHDRRYLQPCCCANSRGRVLKTLLDKLEAIRRELNSDKVFDVVGRLLKGVTQRVFDPGDHRRGCRHDSAELEGTLTKNRYERLRSAKEMYGEGGDVERLLPSSGKRLRERSDGFSQATFVDS